MKNILILDDNEFDRKLVVKLFSKKEYNVIEASNRTEMIEILKKEKVHLLLLDYILPEDSGIKILSELRQEYNDLELPIILLTSVSDSENMVDAFSLGANDYIIKPLHPQVTLKRVETLLKLSDLSNKLIFYKEIDTLSAVITTYNHDINNPLALALGRLSFLKKETSDIKNIEKIEVALLRIRDIVKKIAQLKIPKKIEYETYAESTFIINLKEAK